MDRNISLNYIGFIIGFIRQKSIPRYENSAVQVWKQCCFAGLEEKIAYFAHPVINSKQKRVYKARKQAVKVQKAGSHGTDIKNAEDSRR
ncbi:MAG: hypothetical protein IJL98_05640 [Lachnospiraceae bacterium]|nr:hypothetical protein [Lachnospiraceae bacterium]